MVSQEIRDAGLMISEAVKISLNHTKDGMKITFVVQPEDMPPEMMTSFIGTRYRMVLVELDVDETPKPQGGNVEVRKLIASANLLCKEGDFQVFMTGQVCSEEACATALRRRLGIESRAELGQNIEAQNKFRSLRNGYWNWRNGHGPS